MTEDSRSVILYDEDCGFCKWSLDKILAWDRSRRLRAVAIQSEEGRHLLAGVDPAVLLDSWHLVSTDGKLFSAGGVAAPLARILPWGRPLAAVLGAFPQLTEAAYGYIAGHRHRWARLLGIDTDRRLPRR